MPPVHISHLQKKGCSPSSLKMSGILKEDDATTPNNKPPEKKMGKGGEEVDYRRIITYLCRWRKVELGIGSLILAHIECDTAAKWMAEGSLNGMCPQTLLYSVFFVGICVASGEWETEEQGA